MSVWVGNILLGQPIPRAVNGQYQGSITTGNKQAGRADSKLVQELFEALKRGSIPLV